MDCRSGAFLTIPAKFILRVPFRENFGIRCNIRRAAALAYDIAPGNCGAERIHMQFHSLVVSEPAGILTGFGAGMVTYYLANLLGTAPHTSLVLGCAVHFLTNSLVAGHINLFLLDFLALAVRIPAAAGSTLWMTHLVHSGHLF
jgi:hypothetical protein